MLIERYMLLKTHVYQNMYAYQNRYACKTYMYADKNTHAYKKDQCL